MKPMTRKTPNGASRRGSGVHRNRIEYGSKPSASSSRLPANWRDRLPDPHGYYSQHVPGLSAIDADGMATGQCPLCVDRGGTLTIHATNARGHWQCSAACGQGDMIAFAQRMFGVDFATAVRALIAVRT